MNQLTPTQKRVIDLLLANHPSITPDDVIDECYPSYARSYKIYIQVQRKYFRITHCDHRRTAREKVALIQAYIADRKAAQS